MSRLLDALRADPEAVFEIGAELPSGNRMIGTVGPIINGRIVSSITFSISPPSDEDIRIATHAMNSALGLNPTLALVSNNDAEKSENAAKLRQFLGGGQG